MELISSAFNGTLNPTWRRRRYRRFYSGYTKTMKTVTLGGRNRRFWKLKAIPRLRLKKVSPIRLLIKLKNAYVKTMLRFAGTSNVFGSITVPSTLQASDGYSMEEFQNRLIYEISKNLFASRELATI